MLYFHTNTLPSTPYDDMRFTDATAREGGDAAASSLSVEAAEAEDEDGDEDEADEEEESADESEMFSTESSPSSECAAATTSLATCGPIWENCTCVLEGN